MQAEISAARWAAVLTLQKMRDRRAPNSFEFEVADHAIDLLLNPERPEGPYLVPNALRDARSVLIRRNRRLRKRGMLPLYAGPESPAALEVSHIVESDRTVAASRPQSIETELGWKQVFHRLHSVVSDKSARAGEILIGWRAGEDMAEAAHRLQISKHYVKKLRGDIRREASELMDLGRAA